MHLSEQLAQWADKLRDVSANGLRFSDNRYDRDNYQTIQEIMVEMLAVATGRDLSAIKPLTTAVLSRPTPFSGVDAAVIDENGRILLIQRADNHKWAMPGGALEVGETPAAGAMRETFEETGYRCQVVDFVGVFDSRLWGTVSAHHLYHYVFLCRSQPILPLSPAPFANETLDMGWFVEAELPSALDPGHAKRIQYAFAFWRGETKVHFDP